MTTLVEDDSPLEEFLFDLHISIEVTQLALLGRSGTGPVPPRAPASAGERAGAFDDLAQHGLKVEARGDSPQNRAQARYAPRFVASLHRSPSRERENGEKYENTP